MEIRSVYTIPSVENTPIELELAGVGNRVFAFILDFSAMAVSFVLLLIGIVLLTKYSGELSKTLLNLLVVGSMMYAFAFQFAQEWLWKGKSLGKHLLNIRVVRHDGQIIGFWEAFGRNLLRFIDVYMMGIGLFPLMFTPREKRFGDFLVGTVVINDQTLSYAPLVATPDTTEDRLTWEERDLLQRYRTRKPCLFKQTQQQLEASFKQHFQERFQHSSTDSPADDLFKNPSV